MALPANNPFMSMLVPERHFTASGIVYIQRKKKKYFTTVFFFNLSVRTNNGEFKLLKEMMRRGRTGKENQSVW